MEKGRKIYILWAILLLFLSSTQLNAQNSENELKSISGVVSYLGDPVSDVNIVVVGATIGTKTDSEGKYEIEARTGQRIKYTHISYKPITILVEDITDILNIELSSDVNELDEAVVKARIKKNSVSELEKKMDVELRLPIGTIINPSKTGLDVRYIPGRELSPAAGLLSLSGKIAGLREVNGTLLLRERPVGWVVDGMTGVPLPDPAIIEDIYIIKTYGLIYIRTLNSTDLLQEKKKEVTESYQNQNYYQNDAEQGSIATNMSSSQIQSKPSILAEAKTIQGRVTYLDEPMSLVNVKVVGRTVGVVTNQNGEFTINANVGDIIQFSHIGYATLSIVVEDTTEILNIEMVLKENELDTVVVTADGKMGKTAERAKKADTEFKSSMGSFDPRTSGNAISYIDGSETTAGARDILDVLNGKVAGLTVNRETNEVYLRSTGSINTNVPPIWDVDGVVIEGIPQILPDDVKDIYLLKSLASTTRYGTRGRGGVIVVRTKSGNFNAAEANRNKIAEQYRNQDYYANDASADALSGLGANEYADALEAFESKQKAFIYYEEQLKYKLQSYVDHIAIAQKFVTHFNDLTLATELFKHLLDRYNDNPEIVKAIAYHLQTMGRTREAVDAYERSFKLRPKYAQSYRDLANAYMENNQFKKAWRLYISYLLQGNDVSGEGIGEMIYNEMEWMFFLRKNQTEIKENFVTRSQDIFEFRNDLRVVVEWNTSEAEFDIEFVNPEMRSYVFEHSLEANQELITDEKLKGYSSKEFYIDDVSDGEWLVNITYKGNKKPEPTYFKITTYYNWGQAKQTREINVYNFKNEREKIQLKKFDKAVLNVNE